MLNQSHRNNATTTTKNRSSNGSKNRVSNHVNRNNNSSSSNTATTNTNATTRIPVSSIDPYGTNQQQRINLDPPGRKNGMVQQQQLHPQERLPSRSLGVSLSQLNYQHQKQQQQQQRNQSPNKLLSQNAAHILYNQNIGNYMYAPTSTKQQRHNIGKNPYMYNNNNTTTTAPLNKMYVEHDDTNDDMEYDDHFKNGYSLEIPNNMYDDDETVSSLNDSCFGGSVVSGYSNTQNNNTSILDTSQQSCSPMKQATSLVVGVVPLPSSTLSINQSFDTEETSSYIVNVDQRPNIPSSSLLGPMISSSSSSDMYSSSTNKMLPIVGTITSKKKVKQLNNNTSEYRNTTTSTTVSTHSQTNKKNHLHEATMITNSKVIHHPTTKYPIIPLKESELTSVTSNNSESQKYDIDIEQSSTYYNNDITTGKDESHKQNNSYVNRSDHINCYCCSIWKPKLPRYIQIILFVLGILLILGMISIIIIGFKYSFQFHTNDTNQSSISSSNQYTNNTTTNTSTTINTSNFVSFIPTISPTTTINNFVPSPISVIPMTSSPAFGIVSSIQPTTTIVTKLSKINH